MKNIHNSRQSANGSTLLEALVAILIFSIGILAIVGLQAASLRASADAKYRTVANLLADELIGQMWTTTRTNTALDVFKGDGTGGGAAYTAWSTRVAAQLPVPDDVAYKPAVTTEVVGTSTRVTIRMYWVAPGDELAAARKHIVTTMVQ
jgi:type IV pilus assembly protein PilV